MSRQCEEEMILFVESASTVEITSDAETTGSQPKGSACEGLSTEDKFMINKTTKIWTALHIMKFLDTVDVHRFKVVFFGGHNGSLNNLRSV